MDWLTSLMDGGAGLAAGGPLGLIAGLFGGWLQHRQKRKMAEIEAADRQADREHEIKLIEAESANMRLEAELELKVIDKEGDVATDLARYDVDKEVLKMAQQDVAKTEEIMVKKDDIGWTIWFKLWFAIVEFLRRSYRPAASYYSLVGLTYLVLWLSSEIEKRGLELTDEQVWQMWWSVIDTSLFLAVTCVTFWFVSRDKNHVFKGRN